MQTFRMQAGGYPLACVRACRPLAAVAARRPRQHSTDEQSTDDPKGSLAGLARSRVLA